MQCFGITRTGARCRREAEAGSETCFSHRPKPVPRPAQPTRCRPADFYAASFPKALRKALAQAGQLEGQSQEIAVLRTLIREALAAGKISETRLLIAEFSRLLRTQKATGDASDQVAAWIDEALDILDSPGDWGLAPN